MELNAARQKRFTLGFLAYGAKAELRMPATEITYHINLTTRGGTFAEREDGRRAVTPARRSGDVLLPDQFNIVRWTRGRRAADPQDPSQPAGVPPRRPRPAGRSPGPIDFDFGIGLTTPRGRSLLSSVRFLARELDRPGGIVETPRWRASSSRRSS